MTTKRQKYERAKRRGELFAIRRDREREEWLTGQRRHEQDAWLDKVARQEGWPALQEFISGHPVRVEYMPRHMLGDAPVVIAHDDNGLVLRSSLPPSSVPWLLTHDLGHVLAARPSELLSPNLGLSVANKGGLKGLSGRDNEEKTLSWQYLLCQRFVGDRFNRHYDTALRIFKSAVSCRPDVIWRNVERYRPQLDARWARQMERIRAALPQPVALAA